MNICFYHEGEYERFALRVWPAVPRVGEVVSLTADNGSGQVLAIVTRIDWCGTVAGDGTPMPDGLVVAVYLGPSTVGPQLGHGKEAKKSEP